MTWRAWINLLLRTACVGGSTSPFIDEGDGFTSERERIRMLLSLVTHTDEYEIMVGAHNTVDVLLSVRRMWEVVLSTSGVQTSVPAYTVDAQMHVRSFTRITRYGKSHRPQHYRCLEAYGGPYRMGV